MEVLSLQFGLEAIASDTGSDGAPIGGARSENLLVFEQGIYTVDEGV